LNELGSTVIFEINLLKKMPLYSKLLLVSNMQITLKEGLSDKNLSLLLYIPDSWYRIEKSRTFQFFKEYKANKNSYFRLFVYKQNKKLHISISQQVGSGPLPNAQNQWCSLIVWSDQVWLDRVPRLSKAPSCAKHLVWPLI